MIVDIDNMHINIHEKLKVAVVQQKLDKVQKYLAQGADVNYTNKAFPDDPALIQAIKHTYDEDGVKCEPNIEIIKFLIKKGADVNAKNYTNSSPLHYAVALKNKGTEIIKLLIDKGADVNAKNCYGDTPLHRAVFRSFENAKILIDNGADVNAKDNDGKTPLDIAKDYKEKYTIDTENKLTAGKVVSLLKSAMQNSKPKAISKNGKTAQKAKAKQRQKSNDFEMGM